MNLMNLMVSHIREHGPMTVADYMELALYHPEFGYYSAASRRSGRNGDFFTSVDVGPLFGALLAAQVGEMWSVLRDLGASEFHLVEAGAGDGQLARDMLDTIALERPELYEVLRVTLVERSAGARARHSETLGPHPDRITVESSRGLPLRITGALVANELLDALAVHVVVMTPSGPFEVHINEANGVLGEVLLPLVSPPIEQLLERTGVAVPEGARVEVGLSAVEWMEEAARATDCGFVLLIDYGHEAEELYSHLHAAGTLTAYRSHRTDPVGWLESPGRCDLTADVNLTAVRNAAVDAGLEPLGMVDQTYFLTSLGLAGRLDEGHGIDSVRRRLAARTLIVPGGLGSTMKAMAFGRRVGTPALRGFAAGRVT
jgi:SAM-dependent MidA family methyltransferase